MISTGVLRPFIQEQKEQKLKVAHAIFSCLTHNILLYASITLKETNSFLNKNVGKQW